MNCVECRSLTTPQSFNPWPWLVEQILAKLQYSLCLLYLLLSDMGNVVTWPKTAGTSHGQVWKICNVLRWPQSAHLIYNNNISQISTLLPKSKIPTERTEFRDDEEIQEKAKRQLARYLRKGLLSISPPKETTKVKICGFRRRFLRRKRNDEIYVVFVLIATNPITFDKTSYVMQK